MKVLLVQPYTFTPRGLPQIPLALMYIGGYAEKYGYLVKILDRNFETNSKKIINEFRPDILGITSLTGLMILDGIKISKYVKSTFPMVKIIWGGIHTSILPRVTLQEEYVDFVVVGEGEEIFVNLLNAIEKKGNFSEIEGIGYKQNEKLFINKPQKTIENLNSLPFVSWHLIDINKYLKYETLFITSRGCPHRCAFCYNEKFNFRKWRCMSAERVISEIEHAKSFHPIRRFRFDDDNFCVDKIRVHKILNYLPKQIPLYFEIRIEYLDEEFCRHLAEFKDPFIFTGIESGDNKMLKKMQKDINIEQIKYGYELINKYKINSSASFIIGSPGETYLQLQKTIDLIDEIKPTRPSCCIFVPFPGSAFTEKLMAEGKLNNFKTLSDWGNFTNSEFARNQQYGEISVSDLNKIYSKYWWLFVFCFIKKFRFYWIFAGIQNVILSYFRKFIKYINRDI